MANLPNLLLGLCLPAVLLGAQPSPKVLRLTLDSNTVHCIPVATDRVTTVNFPFDLAGLEGAFVSQQPEVTTRFLLSYQNGARYFSLRALQHNATANLNVVVGRQVYALEFVQSTQPAYVVDFQPPPPRPPPGPGITSHQPADLNPKGTPATNAVAVRSAVAPPGPTRPTSSRPSSTPLPGYIARPSASATLRPPPAVSRSTTTPPKKKGFFKKVGAFIADPFNNCRDCK